MTQAQLPHDGADTRRVFETAELFWITTVRADGRPHVTPLIAVWLDSAISFCTGTAEQKAVNLRQNPNMTLTTGCNQWDHGLDVVVEGEAVQVTSDARLRRLAEAWALKWDGRWQWEAQSGSFITEVAVWLSFTRSLPPSSSKPPPFHDNAQRCLSDCGP